MIPFRVIRSAVMLTGLLAVMGMPMVAAVSGSFTDRLSDEQKTAAGLKNLTSTELTVLDQLVADDIASNRRSSAPALSDRYSQRYSESQSHAAGLDRLTVGEINRLDELIASAIAIAPQPRERPRLRGGDILSEKGRLQVHGGLSFTYGMASGGRDYRAGSAWVSYFDPVTGLGLSFSYSRSSGDFFPHYYPGDYYPDSQYLYSAPRMYYPGASLENTGRDNFAGDGASLFYPANGRFYGRDNGN